jgi:hypothetical protein
VACLAIGPVNFVDNVGEHDEAIHPLEAVLGQHLLPQRVPPEPDVVTAEGHTDAARHKRSLFGEIIQQNVLQFAGTLGINLFPCILHVAKL